MRGVTTTGTTATEVNAPAAQPQSVSAPTDAFFFPSGDSRLFGTWRAPSTTTTSDAVSPRVWIFCAPFAEEEKSAHRTLVELCEVLRASGDATLFFAYSGTGDSEGDFRGATLDTWRNDIRAACAEALRRAPEAILCLAGLRLGATLALQVAAEVGAQRLVLMEPLLQGRSLLSTLNQKKRLRAMVTKADAEQTGGGAEAVADMAATADAPATDEDDFDGWPIPAALRDDLQGLDATQQPRFSGHALVLQIGPREVLLPATERWAQSLGAEVHALKMQPFWNLIDYARADALFATTPDW